MRNISHLANVLGLLINTTSFYVPKRVTKDAIDNTISGIDYETISKAEAKRQRRKERNIKNAK